MTANFKRWRCCVQYQPGLRLSVLGALCVAVGFFTFPPVLLLGLLLLLADLAWQRITGFPIGDNFLAIPSMPLLDGPPHYFVVQRRQRHVQDKSCAQLLRSLIRDRRGFQCDLRAGCYVTVTHDGIIAILRKCPAVRFQRPPAPLYRTSLCSILTAQTKGRCRACKTRCAAWNAPPRTFFLLRFVVAGQTTQHARKETTNEKTEIR